LHSPLARTGRARRCHLSRQPGAFFHRRAAGAGLRLNRLGIHHERLPPGRRTSYPTRESDEEEFIYVLEGYPEVWINGYLWKLEPGDSVGFPAGTGICHTFLNNTEQEVRLLVVGEANKKYNRIYYPLNPGYAATRQDRWVDHPPQFFGPHDGKPRKK
jgi:uncharacterized cupin superfamily protein